MNNATIRLNTRMAELGLCSRREADDWIAKGWVRVNGETAVLGRPVSPLDRIEVDRLARGQQERQVTVLLNKPVGYVSGQAEDGHTPAIQLIEAGNHWREDTSTVRFAPKQRMGLAPAGRLGIDSVGVFVRTQDGRVARPVFGGDCAGEKEYL
ncbi:MAG: S4 domain-containing protein, partial [Burkholderiales bacterium]